MITVLPNGGNSELFHVNVPMDRIMIGASAQPTPLPAGLEWPEDPDLQGLRAELFKLRNRKDAVVGVASRIAADDPAGEIIEWVLHLPARGSVYVTMQPDAVDGGYRLGQLRAGSRDFGNMRGQLSERWVAESSGTDDTIAGRIELRTLFVALAEELPEDSPQTAVGEEKP